MYLASELVSRFDKHYGQVVKFRLLALEIRPYGKLDRVEPPAVEKSKSGMRCVCNKVRAVR